MMIDSEETLRARLLWVKMYQQNGDAGLTCRRCGISRPTLRKWTSRYQEAGLEGLKSQSRRRKIPQVTTMTPEHEHILLEMRRTRHLGPKGLQRELRRLHGCSYSTATIWKLLFRHGVSVLRQSRKPKKPKRYNRPVPGDRVQLDTCKIGKKLYQFTAIDDCTRLRVLGLYHARDSKSAIHFLQERMLAEFPFPIQRVQTDRGCEFVSLNFQDALREQHIKFRPNRPAAPHLNGKVERSQRTDRMEFWSTVDCKADHADLEAQQREWQRFYNEERTHSALKTKTPAARLAEVASLIPSKEVVQAAFDSAKAGYVSNARYRWSAA